MSAKKEKHINKQEKKAKNQHESTYSKRQYSSKDNQLENADLAGLAGNLL
jgi:hypothetical protein